VVGLARRIGKCCPDVIRLEVGEVTEDFVVRHASASIARMSVTRTRNPRMHGRPPHLSGSTVMRSRRFMLAIVPRPRCEINRRSGWSFCGSALGASRVRSLRSPLARP
jgi:hypothetical protein